RGPAATRGAAAATGAAGFVSGKAEGRAVVGPRAGLLHRRGGRREHLPGARPRHHVRCRRHRGRHDSGGLAGHRLSPRVLYVPGRVRRQVDREGRRSEAGHAVDLVRQRPRTVNLPRAGAPRARRLVVLLFAVLVVVFAAGLWGTVVRPPAYEARGEAPARAGPNLLLIRHQAVPAPRTPPIAIMTLPTAP